MSCTQTSCVILVYSLGSSKLKNYCRRADTNAECCVVITWCSRNSPVRSAMRRAEFSLGGKIWFQAGLSAVEDCCSLYV